MEGLIFGILRYIVCQKMDSLASSSLLSHLATSPSFYLRSCSLFQAFPRCCQERFVRLLVLCGRHRSFIYGLRIMEETQLQTGYDNSPRLKLAVL